MQDNNRILYTHFYLGNGYATVAAKQDGDEIRYGISFCSPRDNFCRKTGRELAMERMGKTIVASKGLFKLPVDLCYACLIYEMGKANGPRWARRGYRQNHVFVRARNMPKSFGE